VLTIGVGGVAHNVPAGVSRESAGNRRAA